MDKRIKALAMMEEYINAMRIDKIAIPEQISGAVNVVLLDAMQLYNAIGEYVTKFPDDEKALPNIVYIGKGEEFFRIGRAYQATKMWQGISSVRKVKLKTEYVKVNDIPEHCNSKARGFEIVTATITGGQHTGDDIKEVDVISSIYGRIECKIGKGRVYTAAKLDDE